MNQRSGSTADLAALSKHAPELAETFVSLASDIALVIDSHGVIDKVALGGSGQLAPGARDWVGRAWADTVTGETRTKVEELLREADTTGISRRREINHPSPDGVDIPVSYAAVRLGADGPVLAVGRDLRAIGAIQQQFVDAQQEIEREYWKHRQAEARYRVLFQVATDAVLVVDAETLRIVDANHAAGTLFDIALDRLIGMDTVSCIDRASRPAVGEMLASTRATGLAAETRAWLAGRRLSVRLSATPFRSADGMLLLLRARAADAHAEAGDASWTLLKLVECTPDSVVVADTGGRILMANPAFIELAQFADDNHARGQHLVDLIDTGLADVIAQAREHGIGARRSLSMRGLRGRTARIDVSAALLADEEQECIGLTIRVQDQDTLRSLQRPQKNAELVRAIESLTRQLGQMELPELLARVSAQAERYFVQTAMQISERDRQTAARMLGLSPDQLEARLRQDPPSPDRAADPGPKNPG